MRVIGPKIIQPLISSRTRAFETYVDSMHAIAHNKIMIIDGTTVLIGSFNFTKAADQKNAENLLVIRDDKVAAKFEENWQAHFRHSEYYAGK